MRSETHRRGGVPGVARGVVRLLVLLGVAVAAYVVLSLFSHAARADAGPGLIGTADPVGAVKATADRVTKVIPKPQVSKPQVSKPQVSKPQVSKPQVSKPQVTKLTEPRATKPKAIK